MPKDLDFRRAREEFEDLLSRSDSLEREWQQLFQRHPYVLTECLVLGISPDALTPCKPGQAQADFYFYPSGNSAMAPYGVIEIKRPNMPLLTVPRSEVLCLSASATKAVAQARKYARDLDATVRRATARIAALGNSSHIFVIGGLSQEFTRKLTSQTLKQQARHLLKELRLVPFDTLASELKRRVPRQIHIVVPLNWPNPVSGDERQLVREGALVAQLRLYQAVCTICGDGAVVPFQPTPGKPVLCRACFRGKSDGGFRAPRPPGDSGFKPPRAPG